MYPPYWSRFFWRLLHLSGKMYALRFQTIPSDVSERIYMFLVRLCKYLLCPSCSMHCAANMQIFPPRFMTGEQYWQYTVDFHNRVNERTQRLKVTNAEAEEVLQTLLEEFKLTFDHLEDAFLQDFWTALLLTSFTFSKAPEKPTEDEKKEYREFLYDFCYIVPFGFKTIEQDKTVRDVMFEKSATLELESKDGAFDAVIELHNAVSMVFGVAPKTQKEMKDVFGQNFDAKNATDIARASQMRDEDHKKMIELQQELIKLKDGAAPACDCSNFENATIALSVLLGVVLITLLCVFIVYRTKTKGGYKEMDKLSRKFAQHVTSTKQR